MVKSNHSFTYPILKKWSLSLIALLLLSFAAAHAQTNTYVVYFADKANNPYSVDKPEAFLSPRAIDRRKQQGIAVTETDLPVNPNYVSDVQATGAKVLYTSKWFNAALFVGDSTHIEAIDALPFTTSIDYARPGFKGSRKKGEGGKSIDLDTETAPLEELANQAQNEMLGIPQMHAQGIDGKDVLVAVFDGGFRGVDTAPYFQHLFENEQYIDGYDFVGNSTDVFRYGQHGTEALSCIVAYEPDKLEAAAFGADVLLYVTEDGSSEYRIEEYNWLFAAERADSVGAHIISTSLGYTTFDDDSMNYTYDHLDGKSTVITKAVNMATAVGIVCVVSAGNEGGYSWKYVSAPADAPDILSVGAVSLNQNRVSFSSIGPTVDGRIKPEVSALGLQTVVGDASGNITTANGTSFAAPLIAGLVAGFWQANPHLTNMEVMEKIKGSGTVSIAPNNEIGYGIPDFSRANAMVLGTEEELEKQQNFDVYPNPIVEGKLFIAPNQPHQGSLVIVILQNSTGQTLLTKTIDNFTGTDPLSLDISTLNPGIYILQIFSPTLTDTVKLIRF